MSRTKKYLAALFVVFLHYAGQIGSRTVASNRYYDHWCKLDAVAILAGMLILAAVLLGLDLFVSRMASRWPQRILRHLFVAAIVSGAFAAAPSRASVSPNLVELLWMLAAVVIGFSLAIPRSPLPRFAANGCLLFSPVVVLVGVQMFTWSDWSSPPPRSYAPPAAAEGRPAAAGGHPVYFFVFDEWSHIRSTEHGEFRKSLKNLRELCRQSTVFSSAKSPFNGTMQSLPRLIYQTDRKYALRDADAVFLDGDKATPSRELPSLFHAARQAGYYSYLLGWYHPYAQMLGDQVDVCRVFEREPLNSGLWGRLLWRCQTNVQYFSDPVAQHFWPGFDEWFRSIQWFDMGRAYRREMLEVLEKCPAKGFAFFHLPWPHAPFVFNPDGSYGRATLDMTSVDDYLRQLVCVDMLVGEVVQTLRRTGRFDEATLILTSDHGWRFDPDPKFRTVPDFDRRVPLVIKVPHQQSASSVAGEFCTSHLRPLIQAVFSGEDREQELTKLLEQLPATTAGAALERKP